jgi:hypothetical protein
MAEAKILSGNALELAGPAYDAITAQKFDYFDSRSAAKLHGRAEGIDLRRLSTTELGYTRVPRDCDPGGWLWDDLANTFDELESGTHRTFLHLERDAITLGHADNQIGAGIGNLQLVIPEHGRSCALRLPYSSIVRRYFNSAVENEVIQEADTEAFLDLPLGRSLVDPESDSTYEAVAVRDSFRDWENVLVIGGPAVGSFMKHAIKASNEEGYAGSRQKAVGKALGEAASTAMRARIVL